jgi:hypothetical protein
MMGPRWLLQLTISGWEVLTDQEIMVDVDGGG